MGAERTNPVAAMNRRSFLGGGPLGASVLFGRAMSEARAAAKVDRAGSVTDTSTGKIRGAIEGKVHAFRRIPYGASTEGAGRFLPPVRAQPWTGVRDAL